jgi:N-acetylglucosaminyldiphosphoundecaprenol N-acetyl-beta-D-mannosaminyltransferase
MLKLENQSKLRQLSTMLDALHQFSVFQLPVHLHHDYQSILVERLNHNQGTHVVTLNAEMVMMSETDPNLAKIIQKAELVIPDGSGITLYLSLFGKQQKRCPGIELASSILETIGQQTNSPLIYFYGGAPGITEKAAKIWQEKFPNLSIISFHGYLSPEEETNLKEIIKQEQPNLIFVGLGVPRQEYWISENRYLAPHATWIGVGGSFDIWSGKKTRAPQWLQTYHLEWLYRLYQEPWRWRRMVALPQFVYRSVINRVWGKKPDFQ